MWIFATVTAVLVFLLSWGKAKRSKKNFKVPCFEMVAASLAFVAWASALPETPLQDVSGYKVAVGGFILTATTVAISVVAWALSKSPDYEKVVTA